MNSITPPTDNLYKFIAISGLLLFFSSGYLNYSISSNSVNKYSELNLNYDLNNLRYEELDWQSNKVMYQMDQLSKRLNVHRQMLESMDSLFKDNNIERLKNIYEDTKIFIKEAEREQDAFKPINKELDDQGFKLQRESIKLKGELNRLIIETDFTKSTIIFSYFGMLLGIIISSIGFYFWYNRVQIFLDNKIKSESNNSLGNLPSIEPVPKTDIKEDNVEKEDFKPDE